ncbi:hypothetical protein [Methanoregula sp. UBA64]|jgi:hypothetical protein|uniref:hypothetical protein n=1 Tax=Methanoregula sp. UBA64 TaxID=1915554 RepID=UPI0025D0EDD9|nr:hypothetical protein [Methanoregula sp. UBA64]
MGNKNKSLGEEFEKKGKKTNKSWIFLDNPFKKTDVGIIKHHLFLLIVCSLLTKVAVFFATPLIFHSFIDYYDLGYYLQHGVYLMQGQLPYLNYNFEYPVLLFVPIILSLIPALLLQNAWGFIYTFQILMIICDIITLLCVYLIVLKLRNERTAFIAGLIYATAFSTAYFVITKYDAFPTCFLMIAVLFTIYEKNMRSYLAAALGFFAKIFPAITFPFIILYHAKKTSLKQEIIDVCKVIVPFALVFILPLIIIRPDALKSYLFATGASVGVYVNTVTYTIYSWLNGLWHIGITTGEISVCMYLLMAAVLFYLIYKSYKSTENRQETLIKCLLCALIAVIYLTKFHSPQYIVWFTPLLCILVADDLYKIILFYLFQIFAFIEFPLMFGGFYTNNQYTNPTGSLGWYVTLVFFTLQYCILLLLMYVTIRPSGAFFQNLKRILFKGK